MTGVVSISPKSYRSVWISDVHLGFRGCQAGKLLDFLHDMQCEQLYLVGDIIDLWSLKRKIYWPEAHNAVLQTLFRKAQTGTRVTFIPGNHDELLRAYDGHTFGGIRIKNQALHEGADGKTYHVLHGDQFDAVVRHSRALAKLGSAAYDFLLRLNIVFNAVRRKLGFGYWSLAAFLKHRVKQAVNYIGSFEKAVVEEARRHQVDGVICGHIHKGSVDRFGDTLYCNCGDWVESCTALVERHDGAIELLDLRTLPQEEPEVIADSRAAA